MKKPVLSTHKILRSKSFNEDINEAWVDWAIEMITAGFETESLYILAGISKPYNQFELQELTNKVLDDLKLDWKDRNSVVKNYAYFVISNALNNKISFFDALKELKGICVGLDMSEDYMKFYLLYFAKDELITVGCQYY